MTKIKICGIKTVNDALAAMEGNPEVKEALVQGIKACMEVDVLQASAGRSSGEAEPPDGEKVD